MITTILQSFQFPILLFLSYCYSKPDITYIRTVVTSRVPSDNS